AKRSPRAAWTARCRARSPGAASTRCAPSDAAHRPAARDPLSRRRRDRGGARRLDLRYAPRQPYRDRARVREELRLHDLPRDRARRLRRRSEAFWRKDPGSDPGVLDRGSVLCTPPILVDYGRLRFFIALAFETVGMPPADARTVAALMAEADLQGSDGHGVIR